MNLSQLQAKLRKIAHRELSRKGSALLAGRKRRHSSRRKTGPALLAGRNPTRRHSYKRHHGIGTRKTSDRRKSTRRHSYKRHHTIGMRSASGRHRSRSHSRRHYSGKAMLAGKRHGNKKGTMALAKINAIARDIKRKNPGIEHKAGISKASQIYR